MHIPADAVAQVGEVPITRALLNHWMPAIFGETFHEVASITAPKGIVADPPNYAACVGALQAFERKRVATGAKSTKENLADTCKQLNQAVKLGTLGYLIEAQLNTDESAELGLKVTSAEVAQELKRLKSEKFPTEAAFQSYLTGLGWTVADELSSLRREALSTKILRKLNGEGGEAAERKYFTAATNKWTARTTCLVGYVVEGCKEYPASKTPVPSASSLIEGLTGAK